MGLVSGFNKNPNIPRREDGLSLYRRPAFVLLYKVFRETGHPPGPPRLLD